MNELKTKWIGAGSILYATAHRPYPPPSGQWTMTQTWNDLLFMHYAVDPAVLRPLVPETLSVDTFNGTAWLSITPFWISQLRPPGVPAIPGVSKFPEVNVRTYVTRDNKPGIFFFSLDAGNLSAVWGARFFYRLPYWHARMSVKKKDESFEYSSQRLHGPTADGKPAEIRLRYRAIGDARTARRGSLEYFLAERYCLYAAPRQRLYRADIHHLPWPLQPADAEIEVNSMAAVAGIALPDAPQLLQYSRSLKVLVWAPERLL